MQTLTALETLVLDPITNHDCPHLSDSENSTMMDLIRIKARNIALAALYCGTREVAGENKDLLLPFLRFPKRQSPHTSASAKRGTSIVKDQQIFPSLLLRLGGHLLLFRRSAIANPIWRFFDWPMIMATMPEQARPRQPRVGINTGRPTLPRRPGLCYPHSLDSGQRHLFSPSPAFPFPSLSIVSLYREIY